MCVFLVSQCELRTSLLFDLFVALSFHFKIQVEYFQKMENRVPTFPETCDFSFQKKL